MGRQSNGGESTRSEAFRPVARNLLLTEPMRVAILEDDPDLAELFEAALTLNGLHSVRLTSLSEVTDALAQRPDVWLVDLQLADGSGFGVPERVRAADSNAPVIAITGASGVVERCRRAGFSELWQKPVDPTALAERLKGGRAPSHVRILDEN